MCPVRYDFKLADGILTYCHVIVNQGHVSPPIAPVYFCGGFCAGIRAEKKRREIFLISINRTA
jgi:hypothetical protein